MDKSYELKYHNLEDKYWWFVGHRDIIYKLIKNFDRNIKILEIGCASGSLLELLIVNGFKNIYGIDISEEAIKLCKKKGIKNCHVMDAVNMKFKNEEFDLIIAADVLEHIKDHNIALNEWKRILKKNGKMIIFVPAFKFLWSDHDYINHHYRRYSKYELIKALNDSNFNIIRSSYWNFLLFFPVGLFRILKRGFGIRTKNKKKDQLYELNPFINKIFINLLKFENSLMIMLNFPIGISVFIMAKK